MLGTNFTSKSLHYKSFNLNLITRDLESAPVYSLPVSVIGKESYEKDITWAFTNMRYVEIIELCRFM